MSNDPDTEKNPTPASGGGEQAKNQEQSARELAGKAMGQAKEGVTAGVETFKKLEPHHQIYLVGLAVAFLFSVIFSVMTVQVKVDGPGSGCAGLSALLFLILMLRSGGGSTSGGFPVEVDVDMTLLGFWVPFAGAIAATVVSVKRLMKPA